MDDETPQSKGGRARADALTDSERKAIASRGARARWAPPLRSVSTDVGEIVLPKATHQGKMSLGG